MSASQPQSSPVSNRPRRSGVLIKVTLVLAVAFALLLAYSLWIEPYRVEVVHTEIQGNLASPIKIAHISDLHTHGLRLRERKVIAILNEEKPDIILITGDSLAERPPSFKNVQDVYLELHAPLGVWFVRGNFENWRPLPHEKAFYANSNVHLLLNSGALARPDLWVAGVDDPYSGKPNVDAALSGAPSGVYKILMFHSPAYFDRVAGMVNLCLAGHTHGGQVRPPFMQPLWMPKGCWPYVAGWYEVEGTKMYVSRGIGMSMLPIRFNSRPEVTFITIHP
jgi:predicted MPP superfamily phosphohydrolase